MVQWWTHSNVKRTFHNCVGLILVPGSYSTVFKDCLDSYKTSRQPNRFRYKHYASWQLLLLVTQQKQLWLWQDEKTIYYFFYNLCEITRLRLILHKLWNCRYVFITLNRVRLDSIIVWLKVEKPGVRFMLAPMYLVYL